MSLVYLGEQFENAAGGTMGAFYDPVSHYPDKLPLRWAEIRSLLEIGANLNIRPATQDELRAAEGAIKAWMADTDQQKESA